MVIFLFSLTSAQVTAIVRKELAVAIRDLMHHGLNQVDGERDDNGDGHPSPVKSNKGHCRPCCLCAYFFFSCPCESYQCNDWIELYGTLQGQSIVVITFVIDHLHQ